MDTIRKAGRFLSSMKAAILLLIILISACALGSFLPQGESFERYAELFGERPAGAIVALGLNDVFHCVWFLLAAAFLCANLIFCNLTRVSSVWRNFRNSGKIERILSSRETASIKTSEFHEEAFERMGFGEVKKGEDPETGRTLYYSHRGRFGYWGAWVCHLGILLLILGFGFGQSLKEEYTVYGVPGQSKQIGDTDYILTIDDFHIEYTDQGAVEQYTTDLTVRSLSGESQSGKSSVNAPASLFGMKIFQNSTGLAAAMRIQKNGEDLQSEILCAGDFVPVSDKEDLVICLRAVYPDYALVDGVPMSLSSEFKNPAYLYTVFYQGQRLGMGALPEGEALTIDEYTVTFSDPMDYTLLQVKRDPFIPLALLGGLVTLLGVILSLYVQPSCMWAIQEEDGSWSVRISSRKGGAVLADRFREVFEADKRNEYDRSHENDKEQGTT